MEFKGAARRLDDIDIPKAGARIGVGEDEIHAFMDVEAAGSGFDSFGRPKALFEPHYFYRLLSGEQRSRAVLLGLAYPRWGENPYPKDSYPRIEFAIRINPEAALKSTSWGLGQIMGANHEMVGYRTVFDMVEAFKEDEEHHLNAIVDFLIASGIDDDLRNHDWAAVARVYNGPGYAKHAYHTRMAQRFAWWRKIPDTRWFTPPDGAIEAGRTTKALQAKLNALYGLGLEMDGVYGNDTKKAVAQFQARHRLVVDGVAGPTTWVELEKL